MDPKLIDELKLEERSSFHNALLADCMDLVEASRCKMFNYYERWDKADETYRGDIVADTEDLKARNRKEPEKMVVPISYSQIQTFVTFALSVLLQRDRFFELLPVNEDSHKAARIGEALLQRDLIQNKFEKRLYQFYLDFARFGLAILKSQWVEEKQRVTETINTPRFSFMGIPIGGDKAVTQEVDKIRYQGNRITNVSPYSFFPDPRLPVGRFQEGEFVASEDEYTIARLTQMELDGACFGTAFIKPLERRDETGTLTERRMGPEKITGGSQPQADTFGKLTDKSLGTAVLTEIQREIVPSRYIVDGKPFGPEKWPIKYVIWYVNDNRIIKCEELKYPHGQFTYDVAEYNPDMHHSVNQGLSDTISMLQSVISWFINSRITSVRKVISNRLIVDPTGIEMKDINDRGPIIRLTASAQGRGVDKFVKQLEVTDVTARHMDDAEFLNGMVKLTTGVNENIMGQFYPGRRSAQEARNATSSAASRLKVIVSISFNDAIEPLGRKMLANLRAGLDQATMVRVVGLDPAMEGPSFLQVDKNDLSGDFDFEIFDGTLPSEKGFIAQALQDFLTALMAKPEVAVAFQIDPKAVLIEWLEMRGVRNPERFTLKALPAAVQQQMQMQNAGLVGPQANNNGNNGNNGRKPAPDGGAVTEPASSGFGAIVAPPGVRSLKG
jgi:hypothetical protein